MFILFVMGHGYLNQSWNGGSSMIHTTSNTVNELIVMLEQLDDSRRSRGKRHQLSFAVIIVLFATMSGYFGYRGIEDFINKHRMDLIAIFHPHKKRVPSFSTIRRILIALSFDDFVSIYRQWLTKVQALSGQLNWMGMDGKTLCGTVSSEADDEAVHLVSIFASFDYIPVDMAKVNDKSNEIPLVQQMIRDTKLRDVIFTLDALHCQKQTVKEIIDSHNDYVIAVKENQPKLLRQIKTNIEEGNPIDIDYTLEKNRGRIEERSVFVYNNIDNIDPEWKGLQQIIQVDRITNHIRSEKITSQTQYYISSLNENAQNLNRGIRGHWGVENRLHWVKDVVFKEDASRIKIGNAPQNISLIKSWVITIIQKNKKKSLIPLNCYI